VSLTQSAEGCKEERRKGLNPQQTEEEMIVSLPHLRSRPQPQKKKPPQRKKDSTAENFKRIPDRKRLGDKPNLILFKSPCEARRSHTERELNKGHQLTIEAGSGVLALGARGGSRWIGREKAAHAKNRKRIIVRSREKHNQEHY